MHFSRHLCIDMSTSFMSVQLQVHVQYIDVTIGVLMWGSKGRCQSSLVSVLPLKGAIEIWSNYHVLTTNLIRSLYSVHSASANDVNAGEDGFQRRHLLMSARFNKPERMTFLNVKSGTWKEVCASVHGGCEPWEELRYANYGRPLPCKDDGRSLYRKLWTSDWCSPWDFPRTVYTWEKTLKIIPLRLCEQYPPKPRTRRGKFKMTLCFRRACCILTLGGSL